MRLGRTKLAPRGTGRGSAEVVAPAVAVGVVLAAIVAAAWPLLIEGNKLGSYDWDTHTAHRVLPVLSLLRYHEGPWWSPWFCGGYPAWGYGESAASLVSPFLPAYLLAPIAVALRVEILGTMLIGAAGAMLLAGRYSSSWAVRAFVAVAFALNSRSALQAAAGHAWHLQYAYVPWVLWLADRAIAGRMRDAWWAGAVLALLVYVGGIYPLPHAALALALICGVHAAATRSTRPLAVLAVAGGTAFALSAPKLLPVLDTMGRAPRLIPSVETVTPGQLWMMLTAPYTRMGRALPVLGKLPYSWHEFGIYLGTSTTLALAVGALARSRGRAVAYQVSALCFLALSIGAFASWAPWSLLHRLPPFSSQHVPSRFLYLATLLVGVVLAAAIERPLGPVIRRRRWVDLVLLAAVAALAADLALVSRQVFDQAFPAERPEVREAATFHHEERSPVDYRRPAWATPVYLAMLANTGVLACWAVPNEFPRGAIARGAEGYRGEAYVVNGGGDAKIARWTPNTASIDVTGATPGATLVYNMNFDPSWRANGRPALEWSHAVAAPLAGGDERVELRYLPRTLAPGLGLALLGLAGGALALRRRRRDPSS